MTSLSLRLLCLFILAWIPTNQGFLPGHHYSPRHAQASSTTPLHYVVNEFNDIDIDDVLAQTEQALMLAQDNLSTSDSSSIEKELSSISQMQEELENEKHSKFVKNMKEETQSFKKKAAGSSSKSSSSQSLFGNFVQKATHNLQNKGTPTSAARQEPKQKKASVPKSKHPSSAGSSKSSSSPSVFGNFLQKSTANLQSKATATSATRQKPKQKKAPTSKSTMGSSKSSSQSVFGNFLQKTTHSKDTSASTARQNPKQKKVPVSKSNQPSKSSSHSMFGNFLQKKTTTSKKKAPYESSSKSKHQSTVIKENFQKTFQQASQSATKAIQDGLESKELKDLKAKATKTLMEKTFQQASQSATKAIQDGLESKELKDLKAKATKTLMDSISKANTKKKEVNNNKKKKKQQQLFPELIDVSDRDIDISDVLAEAEAALLAVEPTSNESEEAPKVDEEKVPAVQQVKQEKTKPKAKSNHFSSSKESSAKINKNDQPKAKSNHFSSSKESSPKINKNDQKDKLEEVKAVTSTKAETTTNKDKPFAKSKENAKVNGKGFFENFQLPKTPPELIDVSDRDIDISDVMAEAEAALLVAESTGAESAMPSSGSVSDKKNDVPTQPSNDGAAERSMLSQKWAESVGALKRWNEGAAPIRKTNRAILLYNLVQSMVVHKDLLMMVVAQTTLFLKLQNQRLSPIRKKNRSNMATTVVQFAVLHKMLVIEAAQAAGHFAGSQNQKMRPIRRANRDALARTFVQSIVLHKNLAIDVLSWARTENARMAPIRAENRKNLTHTISRFLLLQRQLFRFAKEQAFVWWSLQSKRMEANRAVNYGIFSHDMVEAIKVLKDIYHGLRAAPSTASAVLSRVVTILKKQMEEEAVPATPETVLESSF